MRYELIQALIQVESGGNDNAVGDLGLAHKAYGCLQIRQPVCDDVNARYKLALNAQAMAGDRLTSMVVCWLYMSIYATPLRLGRAVTDQDMARIWNGGPNGYKNDATLGYWAKVEKVLGS